MDRFLDAILRYRKSVVVTFLILALLSGIFSLLVSINYNMVDYLPQGAQSTEALDIRKKRYIKNFR